MTLYQRKRFLKKSLSFLWGMTVFFIYGLITFIGVGNLFYIIRNGGDVYRIFDAVIVVFLVGYFFVKNKTIENWIIQFFYSLYVFFADLSKGGVIAIVNAVMLIGVGAYGFVMVIREGFMGIDLLFCLTLSVVTCSAGLWSLVYALDQVKEKRAWKI